MKTSTSKTELYTKEEFTSYWDGAGIKELKQALNNLKHLIGIGQRNEKKAIEALLM